jgi:hypothetical protein
MKMEWKVDLSVIVVAVILSLAAITVARIVAPRRYVPIGMGELVTPKGYYLDTENGRVGFGP